MATLDLPFFTPLVCRRSFTSLGLCLGQFAIGPAGRLHVNWGIGAAQVASECFSVFFFFKCGGFLQGRLTRPMVVAEFSSSKSLRYTLKVLGNLLLDFSANELENFEDAWWVPIVAVNKVKRDVLLELGP